MVINDGADTCEIEGLFLLYIIGDNNIDLNKDDGLASFTNNNSQQNDKIRKKLIKIFQTHGLKLEIKCNLKKVDYLGIWP